MSSQNEAMNERVNQDEVINSYVVCNDKWPFISEPDLLDILSYLNLRDIKNVAGTCKYWYRICQNEQFWKKKLQTEFDLRAASMLKPGAKSWKEEYERLRCKVPRVKTEVYKVRDDSVTHVYYENTVIHVALSSDAKYFSTCFSDGFVTVWNNNYPATVKCRCNIKLFCHWKEVCFSHFNQTNMFLFIAGYDTVRMKRVAVLSLEDDLRICNEHSINDHSEALKHKCVALNRFLNFSDEMGLDCYQSDCSNRMNPFFKLAGDDKIGFRNFNERLDERFIDKNCNGNENQHYSFDSNKSVICVVISSTIPCIMAKIDFNVDDRQNVIKFKKLINDLRKSNCYEVVYGESCCGIRLNSWILGSCFSPDKRFLYVNAKKTNLTDYPAYPLDVFTTLAEAVVYEIDLQDFTISPVRFEGHKSFRDYNVYPYASNNYLVSGSGDGKAFIWDRHYKILLARYIQGFRACAIINPISEDSVLTAGADGTLSVWRTRKSRDVICPGVELLVSF